MRFVTHSADETEALGERLAKTLLGGEIKIGRASCRERV